MKKELQKNYEPKSFEKRIYKFWEDSGYFKGKIDKTKKPYTIVIPPPNITGTLHMGHALDNTMQDILIRHKRMSGFSALWIPGTDHASIATEARVVESIKKSGESKESLGRDEFLKRAWDWKEKYGSEIVTQLKELGNSCDWSRECFTLDDKCSEAVKEVFINLYDKGLIYRGEKIINWCPSCKTSISEAEVSHQEQEGSFFHIKYPLSDGSGFLEIATTRPETLLGDTAVAVNPNDTRYSHLIGKTVVLPIVNKSIPIIADDYVDMEFGTGVVKITPAHDPNDFEVGLRHNLPIINIMTDTAYINENGLQYEGLERYEARKKIIQDLKNQSLLVKIDAHQHNVGECYRCSTVVEPRVSLQWFLRMSELAKPAIKSVRNGEIKFVPERFDKIYFNWMENIKDWCISRQLWWGHQIPAYSCNDCSHLHVSKQIPSSCQQCGSSSISQDPDTLDTWFSSALWPFSTLGWPNKTPDFEYFYPTNTLVTGYDIIFFWVARMIFSAIEQTGKNPFDTVLIHGLIRDSMGRKMSKSLGNGINPLEIIEEYGADALRLALVTGNSPGNDMRFSDEKIKSARNFINKLWNATRFILININDDITANTLPTILKIEDKWVLPKYNRLVKEVNDNLDKYELGVAVSKLYDFTWDILCDWYIELTKSRINSSDKQDSLNAQKILLYIISNTIRLLHPFIPFVTEEIWQSLPAHNGSIMISNFPKFQNDLCFISDENEFEKIMDVIKAVRATRNEINIPPSKKSLIYIKTSDITTFKESIPFITKLAGGSDVLFQEPVDISSCIQISTNSAKVFLPLEELVDKGKELERLNHEKQFCEKDIIALKSKVNNQNFISKAPLDVVEQIKCKLIAAEELLRKIEESIKNI